MKRAAIAAILTIVVSGVVAAQKTFRATFRFTMEGAGLHVTSVGETLIDAARNTQTGHVQAPGLVTLEVRVVDGLSYVRIPSGHPLTGGRHWVALPTRSGAGSLGRQQAQEILNSAARDERDVQGRHQDQNRPTPPPGGKDW